MGLGRGGRQEKELVDESSIKNLIIFLAVSCREWAIFVEKRRDCGENGQQKSSVKILIVAFL